jgi:hypothetical protein
MITADRRAAMKRLAESIPDDDLNDVRDAVLDLLDELESSEAKITELQRDRDMWRCEAFFQGDDFERLEAKITEALAPHYQDGDFCHECFDQPWPCRTSERLGGPSGLLEELEAAEAKITEAQRALRHMDVAGIQTALGGDQQ